MTEPETKPETQTQTATETAETSSVITRALWSIAAIGAALALGALVLSGWRAAVSLLVGAGFGAGNLWAIGRIVRGLLDPDRPKGPWIAAGVLKWLVVLGVLYVLMRSGFADILPLALGLATLPLGILVAQLSATRPSRRPS